MIDGVIKYHVEHSFEAAPDFAAFEELEACRARLFALGLIGETHEGIGYGNLSMRDGEHSFFITATQTGKMPALTKAHYTYVSGYDFETFTVNSQGSHKASSEALSHAMIYEIHPDIQSVIHVHSRSLWRMMKASQALSTVAEYGTAEMVHEIAHLYSRRNPFTNNAFVMLGHTGGIITFGRSLAEAEQRLYQLIRQHFTTVE